MFGDDVSEFDALFTVSGNKEYMFGDDVTGREQLIRTRLIRSSA